MDAGARITYRVQDRAESSQLALEIVFLPDEVLDGRGAGGGIIAGCDRGTVKAR